jgi:glycosyltransferase involved in cell wall biosynthesis
MTNLISVIIPTFNRPKDLEITINHIVPLLGQIQEILIIDQSTNNQTKDLIECFNDPKIKYIYSSIPSITIARNIGIKNVLSNSNIICFIDDDVNIENNYFNEISKVFVDHPEAMAVAGYNKVSAYSNIENILKKIFFLGYVESGNKARIISAYGNTYPGNLNTVINAQWLPGVNMCYRSEVFKYQLFDQNLLGYTLAEDIDFTYRLYKRNPKGLFITPFAMLEHRSSISERAPTAKMSYINQIDHFYFHYKNMNTSYSQKAKFVWSLFGISVLRTLNIIIRPTSSNYLKFKYFFKSFSYCLKHLKIIKQGKVREFLNQKI